MSHEKFTKEINEPYDISQQRKFHAETQGGGEDTDKRVMTSHTEMCEGCEVVSLTQFQARESTLHARSGEALWRCRRARGEERVLKSALETSHCVF